MFGKKLLSVVGLLFLGSQIISVKGQDCSVSVDGNACTASTECELNDTGKLFIDGGQIFEVKVTEGQGNEIIRECKKATLAQVAKFCKAEDGRAMTKFDAFCEDTDCISYYTCGSDGLCTEDSVPNSCKRASCKLEAGQFSGCSEGDYLVVNVVDNDGVETIELLEDPTAGYIGKLYQCSTQNACSKIDDDVGYYKNAGSIELSYIKCNGNGCVPVQPSNHDCNNHMVTVDGDNVEFEEYGELVSIDEKVYICLDKNVKLRLEGVEDAKYFMNMDIENIYDNNDVFRGFEGNGYAVIDVKEEEIHIVKEEGLDPNGGNVKMYQYTDSSYKIYERSENVCRSMGESITEFKLESCSASPKDVAYYSKGETKPISV